MLDPPEKVALEPVGEARGTLILAEHDHAHAPGLSVASDRELGRGDSRRPAAQVVDDLARSRSRTPAQKRQRDVKVLTRNRADDLGKLETELPLGQSVDDVFGEPERAEEPDAIIAAHRTG